MPSLLPRSPGFRLCLRSLSKVYAETVALWNIDLEASSRELVVVRGPNGSGKSTLLRLIAGVVDPTAGQVDWEPRSGARPRIGLVTHATHLLDALTVRENLELVARLAHVLRGIDDVLDELGLEGVRDKRVGTLSTGTRRRCGIARALVVDPDVLIIDEPFAGLDPDASGLVEHALLRARRDGRLVVIAMHAGGRSMLPDRVLDLEGGRRRALGAPGAIVHA